MEGEPLSAWDETALELGRFILVWREVETYITALSIVLRRWGGGDAFEPRGPPRSLGRKLTMIEKTFSSNPALAELASLSALHITAWRVFAQERDFLVHSTEIKPFDDLPSVRVMLDRVPWPDAPSYPDIRGKDEMALSELLIQLAGILEFAVRFYGDVLKIVRPHDADQPDGEVVG